MADTDKLVKVGQLDTIVDEIVDKFGETNGRLHQLNALTKISIEEVSGYINVGGSIGVADSYKQEVYTNKILVNPGDVIRLSLNYPTAYTIWAAYATYASDGTFIERVMLNASEPQTDFTADVTVPDGVSSIAFTYRTYGTGTSDIYMAYSVYDKLISAVNVRVFPGYFNADGTINRQSASLECYTQRFVIDLFDKWVWHLRYSTQRQMWVAMAVYDEDGAFLRRVVLYSNTSSGAVVEHDGTLPFEDGDKYFALCYRSYDDGEISVTGMVSNGGVANTVNDITLDISAIEQDIDGIKKKRENTLELPFRFKPLYDHLFVNRHEDNVTIPHESVYHVRHSRKMGFNTIEANVFPTSDGVFIVNHLINGKFGGYFHHVDGTTDITDVAVSSVTWDWIVENVRYNSQIAKYQTRPARLEEFLAECKQQNLIPMIMMDNADVVAIVNKYMGVDNYIAYRGTRELCPTAIIYHWMYLTTKAEILAYCESIGKPFIYGMANPTNFSDSELKDIIDTLHSNGYWIGTSYVEKDWHKYRGMGFDVNGTQEFVNRIENGNICNLDSMYGFSDYVYTNATEADGVLTFSANGTITPDIDNVVYPVCMVDFEISFVGDIMVNRIGEFKRAITYTSDGTTPVYMAIPIINGSPRVSITVYADTVVKDMTFKASRV